MSRSGVLQGVRLAYARAASVVAGTCFAVVLQLPDLGRFSLLPVVLVCLASIGLFGASAVLLGRPLERLNALLFAVAGVLFAVEWAFTYPQSPLPLLALVVGPLFALCIGLVLLRYPGGHSLSRLERALVLIACLFTIIARSAWAVTLRPEWFAFGIAHGRGHLPPWTWWVILDANRSLSLAIARVTAVGELVIVPAFWWLLLRRLRRQSKVVRAETLPVMLGIVLLGCVIIAHVLALLASAYAPAAAPQEWVSGALCIAVLAIPAGFIFAAARHRLGRSAVADLVIRLTRPITGEELERQLRITVGDPTLTIRYRVGDGEDYVDASGRAAAEPSPRPGSGAGLMRHVLDRRGEVLAVVVADAEHRNHPMLLDSALAASALAIENGRLEAQLRARLEEIRASRTRIVESALEERRRIERDLHDGVQQELVAMGALLARIGLRESDDAALRELVGQARDQLRATRHTVRDLARGIHPHDLTRSGLRVAIEAVVERLPIAVTLRVPDDRWAPATEATVYFIVCEALTNCVQYAEADAAEVRIDTEGSTVRVLVLDRGAGGARLRPGGGLAGLRDRAGALDGEFMLSSPPGAGTVIEVRLPCG